MIPHPVDIWTIPLTQPHPVLLSADEAARAARFHAAKDREHWSRSHSALRTILASYAGVGPLDLQFAIGPHGKPGLPEHAGIEFNLSHARDYAIIAVTRDVPVGVDIQDIRPKTDISALLRRLGEPDHEGTLLELYGRWTRREARSKAAGGALFDSPLPDIHALDINAPEGYAAAVALRGFEPRPTYLSSL